MGKILKEIRDELLWKTSPTNGGSALKNQQTPNVSATGDEIPIKHDNPTKDLSRDYSVMSEEQAEIMNNHLKYMNKNTLKSMLKCLQSSNSIPEVQNLIIMKISQLTVLTILIIVKLIPR